ncbi:MAG: DUF4199 domain-containing protein [Bacteroidales bacterium]|nr:DUF4199 domain-containing protein [Bacteroidales bacterium]
MEKNTNIWKNALNWGVILGIVLSIYSLIIYFLGATLEKWAAYPSYIIMIAGIIYATIQYRDNMLNGSITYGKALGFGTLVMLFAGIILAIYSYVLYTLIDPDLITRILEKAEEEMVNKGLPDEQIEMALEMQSKFMKPWIMSVMSIFGSVFAGFIISLFTSIFLKKEVQDNPFTE